MMGACRVATVLRRCRMAGVGIGLLAAWPAFGQSWAWDLYGADRYDGAVSLTDDRGHAFTARSDPTSGFDPATSVAVQPPVIVVQPAPLPAGAETVYWEDRWW